MCRKQRGEIILFSDPTQRQGMLCINGVLSHYLSVKIFVTSDCKVAKFGFGPIKRVINNSKNLTLLENKVADMKIVLLGSGSDFVNLSGSSRNLGNI